MVGLNDSRREDPENFRLVFGAYNISDTEEDKEQFISIDMIIKVYQLKRHEFPPWDNGIAVEG